MNIKTSAGIRIGTDINTVHVPSQLRKRRDLGIDWMNDALGGGGMTPSTVAMVTGSPGSGKSTLFRQLADSITGKGHIAIYNTGEESVHQVRMRCEDMELSHGFQVGEERYLGSLLAYAREVQQSHPNKQVFILQDSLQTLDDGHYRNGTTSNTPVRCCEGMTDWAKESYGIVLFIGQVTKNGIFAGKNTIRHMVDVHMEVIKDADPKSPTFGQLLFGVSKNRFGYTGRTHVVGLGKKGLHVLGDADEMVNAGEIEDDRPNRTRSGVHLKAQVPKAGTGTDG